MVGTVQCKSRSTRFPASFLQATHEDLHGIVQPPITMNFYMIDSSVRFVVGRCGPATLLPSSASRCDTGRTLPSRSTDSAVASKLLPVLSMNQVRSSADPSSLLFSSQEKNRN